MKTYLDCIPCFFRQILEGARIIHAGPGFQKHIIDEFAKIIPAVSLNSTPPEIARLGYNLLKSISKKQDPYKKIKQKSNRLALRFYGKLKKRVRNSKDRLLISLELAIAGNIIDFGVKNNLDINAELKRILTEENKYIGEKAVFHYSELKEALTKAKKILYLADNAGETVFDRVLIEELKRSYPQKHIYYAVKEKPAINDALREDAKICGIDKFTQIISNGTDVPGTILSLCSKEFRRIFNDADIIISKGQGNFESLSEEKRPIFFLFMVKCPVVAKSARCKMGDIVLLYNKKRNRLKADGIY